MKDVVKVLFGHVEMVVHLLLSLFQHLHQSQDLLLQLIYHFLLGILKRKEIFIYSEYLVNYYLFGAQSHWSGFLRR